MVVFAGQLVQIVEPLNEANEPSEHSKQVAEPADAANWPFGHGVATADPGGQYVPAEHRPVQFALVRPLSEP